MQRIGRYFILLSVLLLAGCSAGNRGPFPDPKGTTTGNGIVKLNIAPHTGLEKLEVCLSSAVLGTDTGVRVEVPLAMTEAVEVNDGGRYLGRLPRQNSTITIPAGTYQWVELQLENSCGSEFSVHVMNTVGDGNHYGSAPLALKFLGPFVVAATTSRMDLNIQNFVDIWKDVGLGSEDSVTDLGGETGTGTIVADTPTFATWDPSEAVNSFFGSNFLEVTPINAGMGFGRATNGKHSGKFYWEVEVIIDMAGIHLGIYHDNMTFPEGGPGGNLVDDGCGYDYIGEGYCGGATVVSSGDGLFAGSIFSVALNLDDKEVCFGVDGVWQSCSPSSGYGICPNGCQGNSELNFYPGYWINDGEIVTANFGADPFSYSLPPGYSAGW